jgi:uncharacterized membrane protein YraQ (UPF0718 family)
MSLGEPPGLTRRGKSPPLALSFRTHQATRQAPASSQEGTMSTSVTGFTIARIRCHWRPVILFGAGLVLVGLFWLASRYPQLIGKAEHLGQALPSMAYSHEVMSVAADASVWLKILAATVNWLDSMKIGMTFGVLFGALLHTVLRYYPLKIGKNLYLNSLKGALVGVPMGVCANCAVPTACGLTRGNGRVEVALGFLFSSPNFNPVVVVLTFMALPLAMSLTKYAILLFVILVVVPSLIRWLERDRPLQVFTVGDEGAACAIPLPPPEDCRERFTTVFKELAVNYGKHVWMLLKPTLTIMLLASVAAAILLTLIPWDSLLSEVTPLKMALASLISVFMPVPIVLDVMFAAQLQQQGVPAGYVMMFAMTLGTYSIIPSIYLWREVSKVLAAVLFVFFLVLGFVLGLMF